MSKGNKYDTWQETKYKTKDMVVLPSGEQSVTTETQHDQQVCCLLVKVASWNIHK